MAADDDDPHLDHQLNNASPLSSFQANQTGANGDMDSSLSYLSSSSTKNRPLFTYGGVDAAPPFVFASAASRPSPSHRGNKDPVAVDEGEGGGLQLLFAASLIQEQRQQQQQHQPARQQRPHVPKQQHQGDALAKTPPRTIPNAAAPTTKTASASFIPAERRLQQPQQQHQPQQPLQSLHRQEEYWKAHVLASLTEEPPPGNVVTSYNVLDVLCGRGGLVNKHDGNLIYRKVVDANKAAYRTVPTRHRTFVSESIVLAILQAGGRFLEPLEPPTGSKAKAAKAAKAETTPETYVFPYNQPKEKKAIVWTEISFRKAVQKTSQALREGDKPSRSATSTSSSAAAAAAAASAPTSSVATSSAATSHLTRDNMDVNLVASLRSQTVLSFPSSSSSSPSSSSSSSSSSQSGPSYQGQCVEDPSRRRHMKGDDSDDNSSSSSSSSSSSPGYRDAKKQRTEKMEENDDDSDEDDEDDVIRFVDEVDEPKAVKFVPIASSHAAVVTANELKRGDAAASSLF